MKVLLDADIITFSCAAYNESWGWDACKEDIDNLMRRILETTGATEYTAFISGDNNFRYQINPQYKANRKDKVDPRYRQDSNAYLVTEYGAIVTDGFEADDALGIAQSQAEDGTTIICSIDKDLLMIPGQHYNWRKNEFTNVSVLDGLRRFYRQCITGDRTDNIVGIAGIGPVKSSRLIDDLVDEAEMFQVVQTMYSDDKRLLMNGQCLWILREENKLWEFPHIETISGEEEPGSLQE